MEQRHDARIGWQVLHRNIENLNTVIADKGYDWDLLRRRLQVEGIDTVIKHREHGDLEVAINDLIYKNIYFQQSLIESAFLALNRRYEDSLGSRTWSGQFREIVLRAAIRNIELSTRSTA